MNVLICVIFPQVLHENKLTHTDLKPENILFVNSDFTMTYNVEKVSRLSVFVHVVVCIGIKREADYLASILLPLC